MIRTLFIAAVILSATAMPAAARDLPSLDVAAACEKEYGPNTLADHPNLADHPEALAFWREKCPQLQANFRVVVELFLADKSIKSYDVDYCEARAADEVTAYSGMSACLTDLARGRLVDRVTKMMDRAPPNFCDHAFDRSSCEADEYRSELDFVRRGSPVLSKATLDDCLAAYRQSEKRGWTDLEVCFMRKEQAAR